MSQRAFILLLLVLSSCTGDSSDTTMDDTSSTTSTTSSSSSSGGGLATVTSAGPGGSEGDTSGGSTWETMGDTSSSGVVAQCGNGVEEMGEECDDGNDVDDDACTNLCTKARCGDGIIQEGEDCDDAGYSFFCTPMCKEHICGDGVVRVDHEECDDGNLDHNDGCTNWCTLARCGDGVVEEGVEECDDAGEVYQPQNDCYECFKSRRVFVTSVPVRGNMLGDSPLLMTYDQAQGKKGVVLADAQCQHIAEEKGIPGTFRAWLADDEMGPDARFQDANVFKGIYYEVVQTKEGDVQDKIATHGWDSLQGSIVVRGTEDKMEIDPEKTIKWTGATNAGVPSQGGSKCLNWTTDDFFSDGRIGLSGFNWTELLSNNTQSCSGLGFLYCFQDGPL